MVWRNGAEKGGYHAGDTSTKRGAVKGIFSRQGIHGTAGNGKPAAGIAGTGAYARPAR